MGSYYSIKNDTDFDVYLTHNINWNFVVPVLTVGATVATAGVAAVAVSAMAASAAATAAAAGLVVAAETSATAVAVTSGAVAAVAVGGTTVTVGVINDAASLKKQEEFAAFKAQKGVIRIPPGGSDRYSGHTAANQRVFVMNKDGDKDDCSVWTTKAAGGINVYKISDKTYFPTLAQKYNLNKVVGNKVFEMTGIMDEKNAEHAKEMAKKKRELRRQYCGEMKNQEEQLHEVKKEHDHATRALRTIEDQIKNEMSALAQFGVERTESTKVIVTLGMTGSGKSTLCNRLNGDDSEGGDQGKFETSGGGQSKTKGYSSSRTTIEIEGKMDTEKHQITVVDTPGFNDSDGDDREHINKLCAYLKGCGGINAFVLVRNGSNPRFDMALQDMLVRYSDIFGAAFFERLVIVATRIEDRIKQQFEKNNQKVTFARDICKRFKLELEIPVIPIGFGGDYKESLMALAAAIPVDKEEFQNIKSPIDELKNECRKKQLVQNVTFNKVNKLEAGIKVNQAKLNSI